MKKNYLLTLVMLLPFLSMAQVFNFDGSDDGWNLLHKFTATTQPAYYDLTTVAGNGSLKNPDFEIPSAANIDAGTYAYVGITVKNVDAAGPTYMKLGYRKTDDSGWVHKSAEISTGDTDFKTYWIELTGTNWTGIKDRFRVQFKNFNGSGGGSNYVLPTTPVNIQIDKIEFAAMPPTTEQHIYEFNTDSDTEGWEGTNGTVSGPLNGVLTFSPQANKFVKIKQLAHHVVASQFSRVHITLKNLSTNDDQLRFIFNGDAVNTVDVVISTNDSDFVTYDVDLSGSSAWTGDVLVSIGFRDQDNANNPGQSSGTGDFLIDRIEFTNVVGVNNNDLGYFNIYPNPVKDYIQVSTENNLKQISIYDMTGKLVPVNSNFSQNKSNINIQNLHQGVYLIKVTDVNNNVGTQKFVKTK